MSKNLKNNIKKHNKTIINKKDYLKKFMKKFSIAFKININIKQSALFCKILIYEFFNLIFMTSMMMSQYSMINASWFVGKKMI